MTEPQDHLWLKAPALAVSLPCTLPPELTQLLGRTLAGWEVVPRGEAAPSEITVTWSGAGYRIDAAAYPSDKGYSDLVDCLNEVLIALAFAVTRADPARQLIHCAGFVREGHGHAILGTRKAGKSLLVAREAACGAQVFADDLMLWSERGTFTALGLPVRLRRPVPEDILAALGHHAMIPGARTCYLSPAATALAPAGTALPLDRVETLGPDRRLRKVRFYKVQSKIQSHRVL